MKIVKALTRDIINSVTVQENDQAMVYLPNISGLFFYDELSDENKYCREEVADKIKAAQKLLPAGIYFKIYFAYRSVEQQINFFNKRFAEIKKEYPDLPLAEQERLTRLKAADARGGGYGPHQTGGALDLTLCDANSVEIDMGGRYDLFDHLTRTYPYRKILFLRIPMLTGRQYKNRNILWNALTSVGFQNYPLEWWHWAYGDRAWAAYSKNKTAIYSAVNKNTKFIK